MGDALLIGGDGYVGRIIASAIRRRGFEATTTSRTVGPGKLLVTTGAALDQVLENGQYEQIVHLPQLTSTGADWALDRVDGPHWLVFSSAQLASQTPTVGTELAIAREATALSRGATVLRPTMIFGRGGDRNITKVVRFLRRYRTPVVVGEGQQLIQPVHVDDLAALVLTHGEHPAGGLFEVGGDRSVSIRQLIDELCGVLGIRRKPVVLPERLIDVLAALPVPGLRSDQVRRLRQDKVVDDAAARSTFGWSPGMMEDRLRQAIKEGS